MTAYESSLFKASFRGAQFIVTEVRDTFGRKLAPHDYPFRDTSWQEDLGRKPREFEIDAYISGDDVLAQKAWIVFLVEQAGSGLLIHPTLGICNVVVMGFSTVSNIESGRQVNLNFRFKEAGTNLFPSLITSGLGAIGNAVSSLFGAGSTDFLAGVVSTVVKGADVIAVGVETFTTFSALGGAGVKTATNLFNQAASLVGNFGRFYGGSTGSSTNSVNGPSVNTPAVQAQVADLIIVGAGARSSVESSADALLAVAAMGSSSDMTAACQDYVTTVASAITNPADAINVFTSLVSGMPQPATASSSSIGLAQNDFSSSITDLCRRYAIAELAQAVAVYQPVSYNDAQTLRTNVCAIIDTEIEIAGDQGEDDTYLALKQVRQAVVQDLTARGATLAPLVELAFGQSLPALAVAYRQYQDITRTDQVVAFAGAPHPGFLPAQFQALAQ